MHVFPAPCARYPRRRKADRNTLFPRHHTLDRLTELLMLIPIGCDLYNTCDSRTNIESWFRHGDNLNLSFAYCGLRRLPRPIYRIIEAVYRTEAVSGVAVVPLNLRAVGWKDRLPILIALVGKEVARRYIPTSVVLAAFLECLNKSIS